MPTLDKRTKTPRVKAVIQVNGQRREKRFTDASKASWKAALAWEKEEKKRMAEDQASKKTPMDSRPTLLDFLTRHLKHCEERNAERTFKEKRACCKRLIAYFGPKKLVEDITFHDAYRYLSKQNRERSGNAANKDRKNFAAAWKWGGKHIEMFPKQTNPFKEAEPYPEIRHKRYVPPEPDFWKVYSIAEGQDKVMLLAFLHLGARKGEIFGMKIDDVDFHNGNVRLWTCKRKGGNQEYDLVPLTNQLSEALKRMLEERRVQSEYVFVNQSDHNFAAPFWGEPFVSRQKWIIKMCDRAGVKRFTYHCIRHLSASILFQEGLTISTIQQILRHKSPNTTVRYLHRLGLTAAREGIMAVMDGRGGVHSNP